MCLIQIHCSCGYFWPELFFPPLPKRINSAKKEFAVVSIFSRLLIRKGKKFLAIISVSPSLLCVCTPTLSWGACAPPHMLVHVLVLSLTHKHTQKKQLHVHLHTHIHTFCMNLLCLNFLFWSKVLNILFKGKSKYFPKFLQLPCSGLA